MPDKLLLSDGSSKLQLSDGASRLLLSTTTGGGGVSPRGDVIGAGFGRILGA